MSTKTPARALRELEAQHAALRGMMDRCVELADALDAGRCGPTQLMREVERLRLAFDAHNRFEETLLGPLLGAQLATTRVEPIEHAHIAEHRNLRVRLATEVGGSASRDLREVIDQLRAHLDREEELLATAQNLVADAPA